MTRAFLKAPKIRACRHGRARGIVGPWISDGSIRVTPPPGFWIFFVSAWLTEQFMGTQTWISQIPFGWMALICFAFWLGSDLYDQQGRLRKVIGHVKSIGRFGDIYNETLHHSLGEDHGGKQSFTSIYIPFEFRINTTVDFIRLTSKIYRLSGEIIGPLRGRYNWKIAEGERYQEGGLRPIAIAHIPHDTAHPGVYGDLNIAGYFLTSGTAHVVTIDIFAGKKRQSEKILIAMPPVGPASRFIVLKKGESLFPRDNG